MSQDVNNLEIGYQSRDSRDIELYITRQFFLWICNAFCMRIKTRKQLGSFPSRVAFWRQEYLVPGEAVSGAKRRSIQTAD